MADSNADGILKGLGFAFVADTLKDGATELIKTLFTQAGKTGAKKLEKVIDDFGGPDNPKDELGYATLLYHLETSKHDKAGPDTLRKWVRIASTMHDKFGDDWYSEAKRQEYAGKRRVKWTAMAQGKPPMVSINDNGRGPKRPDPKWMPIGCHLMVQTIEIYDLALKETGNSSEAAQKAAEDFLRHCGFNIPNDRTLAGYKRTGERVKVGELPKAVTEKVKRAGKAFKVKLASVERDFDQWVDSQVEETRALSPKGPRRSLALRLKNLGN